MKNLKYFIGIIFLVISVSSYSQLKVNSSGKVGINNSSPSYQLHLNGDFYFDQSGTTVIKTQNGSMIYFNNSDVYTTTYASLGKSGSMWNNLYAWSPYFYYTPIILSDKSLKKEIKDIDRNLDKLLKLRPVSYKMLSKKEYEHSIGREDSSVTDEKTKSQFGLIAQEVQEIFPELVTQADSNYLGISYMEFIPLLIKGLQEQQELINLLESKIELLETNCCKSNDNLKSASITSSINGQSQTGSEAKLYQNNPNPFSVQTTIRFEIPETAQNAQLHICNMTGTLLKTITINQRGAGNVTINANEFVAGMYLYSLVCDGKIVDTKQMLLTE